MADNEEPTLSTNKIPARLRNKNFRFVRLGKWNVWRKGEYPNYVYETKNEITLQDMDMLKNEKFWKPCAKAPIKGESAWQTTKNYSYDSPSLHKHLSDGFNYGVLAGPGNLRIIDCDTEEFADTMSALLPKTFTVRTGSGCKHFYIFSEYDTNHVFSNGRGEFRATNQQVVGPNNLYPTGTKYELLNDVPIIELSIEETKNLIAPYLRKEYKEGITNHNDTSRSARDYREVIKLLFKGYSKDKIFNEMVAFTKWSESTEQYRQHTYNNAYEYYLSKKEEEPRDEKGNIPLWDYKQHKDGTYSSEYSPFKAAEYCIKKYSCITINGEKPEIYAFIDGYYQRGEALIQKELQSLVKQKLSRMKVSETLGHIQRSTINDRKILYSAPINYINLNNGILDLKNKELIPHHPEIKFCQKIPVNYNPESKTNKFLLFLKQTMREKDIITFQEFCGSILKRNYWHKKAVVLIGAGNTGKTTLIKLLINFFDESNSSSVSLHNLTQDKFAAAFLEHKLINYYDDLDYQEINSTGAFKIATGDGLLSGERKFGDKFQFKNYAKLLFATNKISGVKDTEDEAYYGRWLIFPFNNVFEFGKNTNIDLINDILSDEEKSGMLNWFIQGLERLESNGKFSYERIPDDNRVFMESNSNSISSFSHNCLKEGQGLWVSKEDLYQIYSLYCEQEGLSRATKEMFGRLFITKARYVTESRRDCVLEDGSTKKSVKGWENLELNNTNNTFLEYTYNIKKYVIKHKNIDKKSFFTKSLMYFDKVLFPLFEEQELVTHE